MDMLMDGLLGMLTGFAYFALDAVAVLLLFATWQRSRITGFLVLSASYALGILSRWLVTLSYRFAEAGDMQAMAWLSSLGWLVVSAIGLYGLWDIYRHFKRAGDSAPSVP
jgi:hypothetical protein